jgi:hypothetical protein
VCGVDDAVNSSACYIRKIYPFRPTEVAILRYNTVGIILFWGLPEAPPFFGNLDLVPPVLECKQIHRPDFEQISRYGSREMRGRRGKKKYYRAPISIFSSSPLLFSLISSQKHQNAAFQRYSYVLEVVDNLTILLKIPITNLFHTQNTLQTTFSNETKALNMLYHSVIEKI